MWEQRLGTADVKATNSLGYLILHIPRVICNPYTRRHDCMPTELHLQKQPVEPIYLRADDPRQHHLGHTETK